MIYDKAFFDFCTLFSQSILKPKKVFKEIGFFPELNDINGINKKDIRFMFNRKTGNLMICIIAFLDNFRVI